MWRRVIAEVRANVADTETAAASNLITRMIIGSFVQDCYLYVHSSSRVTSQQATDAMLICDANWWTSMNISNDQPNSIRNIFYFMEDFWKYIPISQKIHEQSLQNLVIFYVSISPYFKELKH